MSGKKDQFLGVRFTKKEKEIIDKFIKNEGISANKFLREAVFTYLNNLKLSNDYNLIHINRISSNLLKLQSTLEECIKYIHKLYREIETFELNKKTIFIT